MRTKRLTILLLVILVPLAGELRLYSFGEDARIALSSPVFLFILLLSKRMSPILSGVLAGTSVVLFRLLFDHFSNHSIPLDVSFMSHFPVFFYYCVYGTAFYFFRIATLNKRPFLIGLLLTIIEVLASAVEMIFRSHVLEMELSIFIVFSIILIASVRTFFVLGIYNILQLLEIKATEELQRKQNAELLMMVSNLYVETIQLNQAAKRAEELTRACYEFHCDLQEEFQEQHAKTALQIAGQMHEIKKDNQRIYAGLSKLLINDKLNDFMYIESIIQIIVESNRKYGEMLGKGIDFQVTVEGIHPKYNTFKLTSLINNLVSNAVEAIKDTGEIHLMVSRRGNQIQLMVSDTGVGISDRNRALIFEPSFTTKYDEDGNASNGIGLPHVKNVVESLGGQIQLLACDPIGKTAFEILLPIDSLKKG